MKIVHISAFQRGRQLIVLLRIKNSERISFPKKHLPGDLKWDYCREWETEQRRRRREDELLGEFGPASTKLQSEKEKDEMVDEYMDVGPIEFAKRHRGQFLTSGKGFLFVQAALLPPGTPDNLRIIWVYGLPGSRKTTWAKSGYGLWGMIPQDITFGYDPKNRVRYSSIFCAWIPGANFFDGFNTLIHFILLLDDLPDIMAGSAHILYKLLSGAGMLNTKHGSASSYCSCIIVTHRLHPQA
jgi:hypothetical protein